MRNSGFREGWVSVLLLLAMGLCLAWTLQAAQLADGIDVLQWVVVAGTLVGVLLARSRLHDLLAHLASMLIGAAWGLFWVATLLPAEMDWTERLQSIQLRVVNWGQQATSGGESYDALMFILFTTLLFWLFSYVAAFAVFRIRWVWLAIIPNGTVILMNAYYNPRLLPYFASYLLLSLLLIVRYSLFEQEDEWQRAKVRYNPELLFDFLRDGAVSAVLIIAVAWFFPVRTANYREWKVWNAFEDPWEEVQFHWNRMFASLTGYGPPRFSFFSDSLTLGGPVDLSMDPIMAVETTEPHYWRALVFDQYTGRGWINTDSEEIELEANAASPNPMPYKDRRRLEQEVQLYRPGEKVIFAASQVAQVNRPATARLTYLPPETSAESPAPGSVTGATAEISIMATELRFRRNEAYVATSYVSTAPPSALRRAGTDYPAWVVERYLQLPPDLPERVRQRAEQATEAAADPYSKAEALQANLREIEYDEKIDAPPEGVDAVDWFLFEVRKGYCDYYSSAMAVMLRTLGIPARVARGYATGEYNEEQEAYVVRESDGHAWTEVYFPEYGWIEFEPTASEPLFTRPPDPEETAGSVGGFPGGPSEEPTEEPVDPGVDYIPTVAPNWPSVSQTPWWQRTDWQVYLIPLAPILLGWLVMWILRKRRLAASSLTTIAFDNMVRYARWLGIELKPSQTPYECAAEVSRVVEDGAGDARLIANLYVQQRYSKEHESVFEELSAEDAWRRLRQVMRVHLLIRFLPIRQKAADALRSAARAGSSS